AAIYALVTLLSTEHIRSVSLRSSAYLCDLCVKSQTKRRDRRDTQRAAEKIKLCFLRISMLGPTSVRVLRYCNAFPRTCARTRRAVAVELHHEAVLKGAYTTRPRYVRRNVFHSIQQCPDTRRPGSPRTERPLPCTEQP